MDDEHTWRHAGVDFFVESDPPIPFEDPEPAVRLPTTGEQPGDRVPVGSTEVEPAPTLHVDEDEHFAMPTSGFLGEDGRLATESSTVREEAFTVSNDVGNVLMIPRHPVDREIPLTVEGEGETIRVLTVQKPDESRRVEEEELR